MKASTFISTIALTILTLIPLNNYAQEFPELDKSPMDAAAFPTNYKESNKLIKIIYSRPQLKGRTVEKLAPLGEVWRAGANEAAELTLYTPMKLGKTKIPAGTYTFYLIPGEKSWTAVISNDLNVWGSYFYKEDNDVARLNVPVAESNEHLEAFSITFNKQNEDIIMHLGWGNTRISIPFNPNI